MVIDSFTRCDCKAVTINYSSGETYSCKEENVHKFFPNIDLKEITEHHKTVCCDHCANRWGLDLCGCGSGEMFGECKENTKECKLPMQVIGGCRNIRVNGAW